MKAEVFQLNNSYSYTVNLARHISIRKMAQVAIAIAIKVILTDHG